MSKTVIFTNGGHQHRAEVGDIIKLQKIYGDEGQDVEFNEVLSIFDGEKLSLGAPTLDGASVTAEILEHKRDKKIVVFKKKRRQNYRRKAGHKQQITVIKIKDIKAA